VRRPREELIRELADDLAQPPRLASARRAGLAWLAASLGFVALATLATGPLRPGALRQLVAEPGFGLDVLLGLFAGAAAILGLMRLRIPGLATGLRGAAPALALLLAWCGVLLLGWLAGRAPPSTLGARPGCWLQVVLFALPPLAAALFVARRAAPLERAWTGLLAGVASGALSALAMELACMHAPLHALAAHLSPILLVAAAGAGLGRLALRRI
jgi:hypothetical protein